MKDMSFTMLTGSSGGGHRDGELSVAQFNNPHQAQFDEEGNLYVCDRGNHCIRKVTTDGMVETVVGIPGVAGFKDGGKEEALFNDPWGVAVGPDGSVYVAEFENNRIRKLAIE
jgi:DNA-binding beta-propeller fold protein YncE